MKYLASVSCAAIIAASLASPAAAQTSTAITGANVLMPFSQILSMPLGRQMLAESLATNIALNNGSSAAARSMAIHDYTIDTNRGTTVANGLGSSFNQIYFNAIYGNNPLVGPVSSNVVQAFQQANAINQADANFSKNFFGSNSLDGSPLFTPVQGITFPANGQPNIYNIAFAALLTPATINPSGDSRPFQIVPNNIARFSGNLFVAPEPGTSPALNPGATTTNAQLNATLTKSAAFPSGHTTFGFSQSIMFAMMVPELYQQIVTRASDYGYSRVIMGAHHTLDVMAGRILATHNMVQLLNNNPEYMNQAVDIFGYGHSTTTADFAGLFARATGDFRAMLAMGCGADVASCVAQQGGYSYAQYQADRAAYNFRMTYGLTPVGPTNLAPVVPVGAEVLLATRFPYLTAQQRREVLATTEFPSGAALDNGTGWARLNLFEAAGGYGAINGNTTVVMDAAKGGFHAADTWMNDIGGNAVLTKAGSGSLTLAGRNSFGGVAVAGGTLVLDNANNFSGASQVGGAGTPATLVVNGALASAGGLTVASQGVLGGSGSVGPLLTIAGGGVLAPGNSIGTLSVAGNARFAPGSTFQVETSPTGASDRLVVSGTAQLGGGVQVLTGTSAYAGSTRYTIVGTGSGINGAFDGVTSDRLFVSPTLSYDAANTYLTLTRLPFQSLALTPNQARTAAAADSLGPSSPVWNAIDGLATATQARTAYDALSGEVYASAKSVALQRSNDVRDTINSRLRQQDGLGVSLPAGAAPMAPAPLPNGLAAPVAPAPKAAAMPAFTLWGQAYQAFGRLDGNSNAATASQNTSGFFIGGDTAVADGWRAGVMGGYSRTSMDVNGRFSSASIDNYTAAAYGGGRFGAFALRMGAAYTWNEMTANRSIIFQGYSAATRGKQPMATAQVFAELGYDVRLGAVALEPYVGVAHVNVSNDAFTEAGSAAPVAGRSGDNGVTFTTLGLRGSSTFMLGNVALSARAGLGWRHAFGDVAPDSVFAFAGGGVPFLVSGVPIARDAALIEAGLGTLLSEAVRVEVSYTGQLARDEQDQRVKASLLYRF